MKYLTIAALALLAGCAAPQNVDYDAVGASLNQSRQELKQQMYGLGTQNNPLYVRTY